MDRWSEKEAPSITTRPAKPTEMKPNYDISNCRISPLYPVHPNTEICATNREEWKPTHRILRVSRSQAAFLTFRADRSVGEAMSEILERLPPTSELISQGLVYLVSNIKTIFTEKPLCVWHIARPCGYRSPRNKGLGLQFGIALMLTEDLKCTLPIV